ncbi:hypothetical protein GFS24_27605 [Chitinophaga sp. SYP-B3965]|uniref:hypothetical protein n=1 Tax=Chitinophaga sp. SYP-B3965 TaxID=2663120 RepID=UPI0012997DF1|nr:hypothetical protein [Chitinophaga sp. SYP-B3965]MRG48908.1 hypothetical protein [Chitinophaga sp. SYP-B3965]
MKQFLLLFTFCVVCQHANAQLAYRRVLSNAAEIKMPAEFYILEERIKNFKYPKNPPTEVYSDSAARVNLVFKITNQPLAEKDVFKNASLTVEQVAKTMGYETLSTARSTINGKNVYVVRFISQAADTKIYNLMFMFSLNGKFTIGSFNCVIRLRDEWESVAEEMVQSLKFMLPKPSNSPVHSSK